MKYHEKVFVLNDHASFRELGDEGIILMTDSGQLYSTNSTGTAFLSQLESGKTFQEIIKTLSDEFDVSDAELSEDLTQFAEHLLSEEVLRI